MKRTLKHIATIQTGIFAKTDSKGDIVYLQAKHFNENGHLLSALHPELKTDSITEKHLLKHGDVLFAAKGTKNFATWFRYFDMDGQKIFCPCVASNSFFVIRLQENFSNKILPKFLVWLINHPTSQKFLKAKAIGTSIASISKTVLEELEIFIPNLKTQKAVLNITRLRNIEKKLQKQILTLREKQIQQQIINAIK